MERTLGVTVLNDEHIEFIIVYIFIGSEESSE